MLTVKIMARLTVAVTVVVTARVTIVVTAGDTMSQSKCINNESTRSISGDWRLILQLVQVALHA
jgi:hypothetical protein